MLDRLVGAGIGVGRRRFRLQRHAGIEMQRTVGTEADLVLANREVAGVVAVKMLAQHLVGAVADALAQRFADADALAGDSDRHELSRR